MPDLRLVIADDESLIRLHLRESLLALGYLVVGEADNGVRAVQLARMLRPDVVLLDIKMPHMDGLEAARILCDEHIAPVVLLTGHKDPVLTERASVVGAMAYVIKPFHEAKLDSAIQIAHARFMELQALGRSLLALQSAAMPRIT